MTAPCSLGAQAVVAFDIGLWLTAQGQGLRGIGGRPANDLAIDQPVLTTFSTWVLVATPSARANSTAVSTACSSC